MMIAKIFVNKSVHVRIHRQEDLGRKDDSEREEMSERARGAVVVDEITECSFDFTM